MLSFIKFGPGGIRTHDQRIMSPLRYRCVGLRVSEETLFLALPNFTCNVTFSHFPRSVATGPSMWLMLFNCHCACGFKGFHLPPLPTSQKILNGSDSLRQSATDPLCLYYQLNIKKSRAIIYNQILNFGPCYKILLIQCLEICT